MVIVSYANWQWLDQYCCWKILFLSRNVSIISFIDEKMFMMCTLTNPLNNRDSTHLQQRRKKTSRQNAFDPRLVSRWRWVGVSKMSYTSLIFVEPILEVNVAYYPNALLLQQLLPAIYIYIYIYITPRTNSSPFTDAHGLWDKQSSLIRVTSPNVDWFFKFCRRRPSIKSVTKYSVLAKDVTTPWTRHYIYLVFITKYDTSCVCFRLSLNFPTYVNISPPKNASTWLMFARNFSLKFVADFEGEKISAIG